MYVPSAFDERDPVALAQAIADFPFATLVTKGSDGLRATHLPLLLDPAPAPHGTLVGHVAKANPQWRDTATTSEALAIFTGPDAYVSPASYAPDGAAVPTWNYVAVHAYGPLRAFDDRARLRDLVVRLTQRFEANREQPWTVARSREADIERMLGAIVGLELPIARLYGAWKLSQNRSAFDRRNVERELLGSSSPRDNEVGAAMRRLREASETAAPT